ncbi:MAG: type II toxin-antitoxin system Phd/YefM family antitoxin [Candidatus Levybacteria bacterium]|nr:type II toxin-antitoxin system Phd/YefM family antitoxin [Candidatus Levybacteria bacterium]
MTQTLSITKAQETLQELVKKASKKAGDAIITIDGKPSAVLISFEEYDSWKETEEILNDPKIMKDIKEAEEDIKAGRVYDWEDVKKELSLETHATVSDKISRTSKKTA